MDDPVDQMIPPEQNPKKRHKIVHELREDEIWDHYMDEIRNPHPWAGWISYLLIAATIVWVFLILGWFLLRAG